MGGSAFRHAHNDAARRKPHEVGRLTTPTFFPFESIHNRASKTFLQSSKIGKGHERSAGMSARSHRFEGIDGQVSNYVFNIHCL
mgnify:CR=1 FL=1